MEVHTSCPLIVVIDCSVDKSHSFTVASSELDTTFRPSTEKQTALLGLNSYIIGKRMAILLSVINKIL